MGYLCGSNLTIETMKHLFTTIACSLLLATGTSAQSPYIALQGASESAQGLTVSQPRTILAVDLEVECDRILAGPYARYAQKFLGLRAPLTDKTVWTVKNARTSLIDAETALFAGALKSPEKHTYIYAEADDEFPRVLIDKTSVQVPTLEDAARDAVNTIYSLRRHRMELITAEAGENVFGEGLKSALAEIDRLEQSYLELFLGKRTITISSHRYVIYPQTDKQQYVVCRFSAAAGVLPDNDLSGDMVMLQIEPAEPQTAGIAAGEREPSVVSCRVAAPSKCKVICNSLQFESVELPIFEFGRTVPVALPRRK